MVAVRDDGGGGCAVTLFGPGRYWGMRAVGDVGRWAQRCQRRAVVSELTMTTMMGDDTTRGEGQTTTTSGKSSPWKMQGNNHGGDNSRGEHWTVQ